MSCTLMGIEQTRVLKIYKHINVLVEAALKKFQNVCVLGSVLLKSGETLKNKPRRLQELRDNTIY